MNKDIVRVEWHLTPKGWVRGHWSINKPFQSGSLPPADRIETWMKTETTHNRNFAQTQRHWSLTWASPDYSEAARKAMRARIRKPAPDSESSKHVPHDFPLR